MHEGPRRREFRYDTMYFALRTVMIVMALIFIVALFGPQAGYYLEWFLLLVGLLLAMTVVFGISPMLTRHWLTRSRLVLRRGWYFKAIVPLIDVSSMEPYDGEARLGITLSPSSRILFVTSAKFNLVQVRLKVPRHFLSVLGMKADRIVFNVENRNEFLAAAAECLASLAPIQAKGSDS